MNTAYTVAFRICIDLANATEWELDKYNIIFSHFCWRPFQTCRLPRLTARTLLCLLLCDSGEIITGSVAATVAVASRLKGTLHTSAASDSGPLCESHRCIIHDKDLRVDHTFFRHYKQEPQILSDACLYQVAVISSSSTASSYMIQ